MQSCFFETQLYLQGVQGVNQMKQKRILLVDDNQDIHKDYLKILTKNENYSLEKIEEILFGHTKPQNQFAEQNYTLSFAVQGQEALELVKQSILENDRFAVAFVDMRMPPGWDGVETIKHIWEVDPGIQMVICSAYSDHSWDDITRELGNSDNLLILKKPFEVIEIKQLAAALTKKWELIANLQKMVKERTHELENQVSLNNATLESIEEGILAVGIDKQILAHNQNFLNQWQFLEDEMASLKTDEIFQKIAEQLEDEVFFLKTVNDLIIQPKSKNTREWILKTNNSIELYTQPQYMNNEIIGVVFSFKDITDRKKMEQQLLHQATHDTLTGLPNRALLLDRINLAIAHAKRFDLQVAVVILDLDSFKEINDSLGHSTGDELLKCQATKLSEFIRVNDTVARYGGDEFVIVLTAQTENNFIPIIERLIELFAKPCAIAELEIIITASIGVSIYPQDGDKTDTLLKNADIALYKAKEDGRNRFQFFMEDFNKHILERAELKIALSQALQKNELSLNYQPLFELTNNQIIGVEALLRWDHPAEGSIPPMDFIPIAEKSGLIIAIGEWVLRTACVQMTLWQQSSTIPPLKISVNISAKQFKHQNFASIVEKILNETKLPPQCLEIEITENLIMDNVKEVIEKMAALKKLGVRFAIDDFGTGYSSLSYLKHFPFDTVKIDKSFIDNITTDANNASIVEAIIGMTKNMGIDVLAEGVEHLDQVNFLKKHHGEQVQGYYFSKPLNVDDCSELLSQDIKPENNKEQY